jgi:hypothetical protein
MKTFVRKARTALRLILIHKSISILIEVYRAKRNGNLHRDQRSSRGWTPVEVLTRNKRLETNLRVALTAHVYYADFVPQLLQIAKNINHDFSLMITTCSKEIQKELLSLKNEIHFCRSIDVRLVPNRGRNFGPLLVEFGRTLRSDFDVFLHVHSKKSLHSGREQKEWADYLFTNLAGSPDLVEDILGSFSAEERLGLIYPVTVDGMPSWVHSWLRNSFLAKTWLKKFHLPDRVDEFLLYPVGGMFWARGKALDKVLSYPWSYNDFSEEAGQNDGTLQHVIERIVTPINRHAGYTASFVFQQQLTTDNSFAWRDQTKRTPMNFETHINKYKLISWDLFDTLIYRKSGQPDLAKYKVGDYLVKNGYLTDPFEYVSIRNQVEDQLRRKLKFGTDLSLKTIITEIDKLPIFKDQVIDLEQLEFNFDLDDLFARTELKDVFNSLSHKSIIVSDTYYDLVQVEKLLLKSGLNPPKVIYVSSETGLRKDSGHIWPLLKKRYLNKGYSFLHLGDNHVSDCQNPGDIGLPVLHIPSAKELFEIGVSNSNTDDYYPSLREYCYNLESRLHCENIQKYFNSPFGI